MFPLLRELSKCQATVEKSFDPLSTRTQWIFAYWHAKMDFSAALALVLKTTVLLLLLVAKNLNDDEGYARKVREEA
ncbi:uncharacterized protein DS421_8g245520 [Arachis hypogaea]|nr:uncharacterized protein DS421_8g245520 [Arachis hypogaea]